jgi:hypothetical protein
MLVKAHGEHEVLVKKKREVSIHELGTAAVTIDKELETHITTLKEPSKSRRLVDQHGEAEPTVEQKDDAAEPTVEQKDDAAEPTVEQKDAAAEPTVEQQDTPEFLQKVVDTAVAVSAEQKIEWLSAARILVENVTTAKQQALIEYADDWVQSMTISMEKVEESPELIRNATQKLSELTQKDSLDFNEIEEKVNDLKALVEELESENELKKRADEERAEIQRKREEHSAGSVEQQAPAEDVASPRRDSAVHEDDLPRTA